MRSFVLRFPGGLKKAMTFSYDDGVMQDVRLSQLMKKHGVKATFNVNSHMYRKTDAPEGYLSLEELKAISDDENFEIACHGHVHPLYTFMPQAAVTDDMMINRKFLEKQTGKMVRGFAYPSLSAYNDTSELSLKSTGIVYARLANNLKNFFIPENWHRWEPSCHHNEAPELFEIFKGDLPGIKPMIMYVWGHSYEFDRQNNWELIEGLLEECSKTTDIWYATNMEIYNYVNAFKQLVFSADGTFVHNPTAITLWGVLDGNKKTGAGKIIEIAPGETVELHL
ncbi:MAG: polysaccharide deacetylase family protein [Clostridia bacterium]|nr:polysaccharide deacetylase family protein [Clostridia bacterium]MBQ4131728.1 polysaccharide deacetylase family protein [Clostridia bacterium]MBQ9919509.1 polysaccharide deacetylase family protein [Clostridia bacterium]